MHILSSTEILFVSGGLTGLETTLLSGILASTFSGLATGSALSLNAGYLDFSPFFGLVFGGIAGAGLGFGFGAVAVSFGYSSFATSLITASGTATLITGAALTLQASRS